MGREDSESRIQNPEGLSACCTQLGKPLAYRSDESGLSEVYVRPFPGAEGKWQVSTEGGVQPRWSRRSRQLYFEGPEGRLFFSRYRVEGTSFLADRPVEVLNGSIPRLNTLRSFDLHPDGRILVRKRLGEVSGATEADRLVLFENFFDYLSEQVPVE